MARQGRSARFTVIPDSAADEEDYIILDVPPAQVAALHEKVSEALAAKDGLPVESVIAVYVQAQPHRQVYVGADGARSYPPSLLRDDIDPPPATQTPEGALLVDRG